MTEQRAGGLDIEADVDGDAVGNVESAEMQAYHESAQLSVAKLAGYVLIAAGQKISAVAVGLKDARPIRAWQEGGDIREDNEARLRLLYRVTKTVSSVYDEATARAFLRSSSPYLDDQAPVLAIAADRQEDVLRALRAFVTGPVL